MVLVPDETSAAVTTRAKAVLQPKSWGIGTMVAGDTRLGSGRDLQACHGLGGGQVTVMERLSDEGNADECGLGLEMGGLVRNVDVGGVGWE
ncbi:unnamed protein product [Sphenostylis stenocarpa]|uniref:Uncharacterized protein n=1 Tax=Sphenostylis stenocarpa TaxID=92480 RepID=A0AA86T1V0_9FABA|nr:unnamed protein product [Sphenostylis stenocarpa]